jgi:hypothetical protein
MRGHLFGPDSTKLTQPDRAGGWNWFRIMEIETSLHIRKIGI